MPTSTLVHIVYSGMGGTSDYVFNLIRGDVDKEYTHTIVFFGVENCPDSLFNSAREVTKNIEVIVKTGGYDADAYARLKAILRRQKPSAVTLHVNSLILPIHSRLPEGCKLFFVEHQANHLKSRKEWLWSVLAQRRSDYVISLTEQYRQQLKKRLHFLFKPNKNKVIATGIELSAYRTERTYQNVRKIGMIGRVNSFRDQETLIKAFAGLNNPELELHIAGDGPLLKELISAYSNDTIIFHGMLSGTEVAKLLKELDIYVHASFGETSSLSIKQAQAAGLPIIASDVKGINNQLSEKNALFFKPGNVEELKVVLQQLIKEQDLRLKLGNASVAYAEKHLNAQRMTSEYINLIDEINE